MRNLKRALSLTLASVMLLGMMVVGSSAAGYDDVKETDNVEAIEVLQAIEVMVGDERGFGPDRPVNRAEMAVVMGKLLNLDYNYYSTACPFNDVYDWARGYVGACAANKIVSGRGDGIYDPGATVTAVEAASMLMRALGYFQYANDVADGFVLSTVREGNKIGIFDGVGSSADAPMTRNQVAQMVLNALQSAVVEPDGNTTTFLNPDGTVLATTGKVNYVSVTSQKPFARTIGRTQATSVGSQNDGWIVELGERLYDGKLKLTDTTDAFERPARHWEFDGKDVGTYMKKEQLRQEWSVKVTGRMLYDVLTKPTIDDYDFTIAVDGVETVDENKTALGGAFFTKGNLIRSNTETVGATGKGVLTQVFVDTDNEQVYIAVINTYLAKATADYNEKKDEATFEVWSVDDKNNSSTNKLLVKNTSSKEVLTLSGEDFDVEDVKKDDIILVNVAEGEVKVMTDPEVIDKTEIDTFKRDEWVVAEGTQYDYASSLQYDDDVLNDYDLSNMKDTTYRIYLDKYGYAIGVEIVEEADNYVFLTGIDGNTSNLTNKTADGNLIFTDGTMKTAKINMEKSRALKQSFAGSGNPYVEFTPAALWNTWCTYSVDADGVYTLTQVANTDAHMKADDKGAAHSGKRTTDKVGQGWDSVELTGSDSEYTTIIDKRHIALDGLTGQTSTQASSALYNKVYGNDDSVYINVAVKKITDATKVNPYEAVGDDAAKKMAVIINDVDSVATGVQNVSLKAYDYPTIKALETPKYDVTPDSNGEHYSYGVYTLFGDNGYVIAAIVVGEDDGVSSQYAYAFNNDVEKEHWDKDAKEWTWNKDVIIDGELVNLTEVGSGLSELEKMTRNNWYEVKFKANGNVKSVTEINAVDTMGAGGTHGQAPANTANAKDYVFCKDYAGHIGSGNYPKFIGKIEMVQSAQVDNTTGKVVLFEDMYTSNTNGNGLSYTLSAEGTSLQVKNATGGLVKGFAVSGNAKTVLIQDKRVIDNTESELSKSLMADRAYFTGGQAGLESAIKRLNLNKPETDKFFRGYVSAVFENGSAQTIIIYEKLANDVNWGDSSNNNQLTWIDTSNINAPTYEGATPTDEDIYQLLLKLGYTKISKDSTGKWNYTTPSGLSYSGQTITPVGKVKVTINGKTHTVNSGSAFDLDGAAELGATYSTATHGTYAKVIYADGTTANPEYVAMNTTPTVSKNVSYEIGYYNINVTANVAGTATNANAGTTSAATVPAGGIYAKKGGAGDKASMTVAVTNTAAVQNGGLKFTADSSATVTGNLAAGTTANITVEVPTATLANDVTVTLTRANQPLTVTINVNGVARTVDVGSKVHDIISTIPDSSDAFVLVQELTYGATAGTVNANNATTVKAGNYAIQAGDTNLNIGNVEFTKYTAGTYTANGVALAASTSVADGEIYEASSGQKYITVGASVKTILTATGEIKAPGTWATYTTKMAIASATSGDTVAYDANQSVTGWPVAAQTLTNNTAFTTGTDSVLVAEGEKFTVTHTGTAASATTFTTGNITVTAPAET